jgi:hypothetical protein
MIPENPDDEVYELDEDRRRTDTPLDPPAGTAVGDFPERWAGGPVDDSEEVVEGFGGRWSGKPDDSAERSEELGARWSNAPDDSAERSEEFGETWTGDNQPPRD